MNVDEIKQSAIGRWSGILEHLSIGVRKDGKHSPCPFCGGKDRFRWDDKDGTGSYICNQCGAGDGWSLIQKSLNLDFIEAVKTVAGIIGHIPQQTPNPTPDPRNRLNALWKKSLPVKGNDPVSRYLHGRGLVLSPNDVRFCPACYEPDTSKDFPAMVALVRNHEGKPVTIHRTYLGETGKADIECPKKLMPGTEKLNNVSIRLFPVENDTLGIAEGIETAIAARQLFNIPTWAAINTTLLESFMPPAGVRKIVVFGDRDPNFAGQKAAYNLANKLYLNDFIVEVQLPETVGDWNDILLKSR